MNLSSSAQEKASLSTPAQVSSKKRGLDDVQFIIQVSKKQKLNHASTSTTSQFLKAQVLPQSTTPPTTSLSSSTNIQIRGKKRERKGTEDTEKPGKKQKQGKSHFIMIPRSVKQPHQGKSSKKKEQDKLAALAFIPRSLLVVRGYRNKFAFRGLLPMW